MSATKKKVSVAGEGAVTLHVDALEVHFDVTVRDGKGRYKRRIRVGGAEGKALEVPECDFERLGLEAFVRQYHEQMTKQGAGSDTPKD